MGTRHPHLRRQRATLVLELSASLWSTEGSHGWRMWSVRNRLGHRSSPGWKGYPTTRRHLSGNYASTRSAIDLKCANAGQRGIFDDYLGEVSEAERRDLFQELLTIELESRSSRQEQATPQEYFCAYPAFRPQIDAAFSSVQSPSAAAAARPSANPGAIPASTRHREPSGRPGRGGARPGLATTDPGRNTSPMTTLVSDPLLVLDIDETLVSDGGRPRSSGRFPGGPVSRVFTTSPLAVSRGHQSVVRTGHLVLGFAGLRFPNRSTHPPQRSSLAVRVGS